MPQVDIYCRIQKTVEYHNPDLNMLLLNNKIESDAKEIDPHNFQTSGYYPKVQSLTKVLSDMILKIGESLIYNNLLPPCLYFTHHPLSTMVSVSSNFFFF